MSGLYCGLDFGTSNSTAGIVSGNGFTLCPLEGESVTLPSSIFFDYEEHRTRFGRDGIGAYVEGTEGRLLRALKSVLGSALVEETTLVGRRRVSFRDIIGLFLHHLKTVVETRLGGPVDSVVLGRPVRFVDHDDAADARAEAELVGIARAQGFRHIELQYEPVAAALDYEQSVSREELALIVDLGGGTSDFAVTRLSPRHAGKADRSGDILGRAGVHIGGTDFDRDLSLARAMPELGMDALIGPKKLPMPIRLYQDLATWHRIPSLYTSNNINYFKSLLRTVDRPELVERLIDLLTHRNGHRLAGLIEGAKIALSDTKTTAVRLPLSRPVDIEVTRDQLETVLAPHVAAILAGIDRCLREAGTPREAIEAVFLTGGSTAVPVVRRGILAHLPQARPVDGDIFGSVGIGLAIDARRKFGM
ncbi:Hsp70 family protein [Zavarzinia sp.]|uniref:Hsp70 family protein n=1 Tax=Zavarzinia sp. TaxID=2027920 RepID=UPI003BB73ED0